MIAKGLSFWFLHIPGWLLLAYLIYAQAIPAIDYELGISMGAQESANQITEIGVAFFWGFAFGDLVTYIPLLATGLVGHWLARRWATTVLAAALGITVYWPVVCLSTVFAARSIENWNLPSERDYWIVLPIISMWGLYGLWYLIRDRRG